MQRIPKAINKKRLVRYKEGAEDRMVLVDLDVFDQYLESFRVK